MKISKIAISPMTAKRQNSNQKRSKAASSANNLQKSSHMSGISFRGYKQTEELRFATSGHMYSHNYEDYEGKKRSFIQGIDPGNRYNCSYEGYKCPGVVYYADIDEKVDKANLSDDINYVVEHVKPQPPKFSEVKKFISNKYGYKYGIEYFEGINYDSSMDIEKFKEIDYHDPDIIKLLKGQIQHNSLWVDLYTKQREEAQYFQALNEERNDEFHLKVGKMYLERQTSELNRLNSEIDVTKKLIILINKAIKVDSMKRSYQTRLNNIQETEKCIKSIKVDIRELEKKLNDIKTVQQKELSTAKKEYEEASNNEKDEYLAKLQLAKSKPVKTKRTEEIENKISKLKSNLRDAENALEFYTKEKQEIEQSPIFPDFDGAFSSLIEQIRTLYEQNFPEYLDE